MAKPKVNFFFDPRAEIWIDEWPEIETRFHTSMTAYSSCFDFNVLPDYLGDKKVKPLIIMTQDKYDFHKIDYIARYFQHNFDTIILWAGRGKKPEKSFLPVLSWNQVKSCPDRLDWPKVYQLALMPE